MRIVEILVPK